MGGGERKAASIDHALDHTMLSIPMGSSTDIAIQISSSVNSVHTQMLLHTQHKSTQERNVLLFPPLPFELSVSLSSVFLAQSVGITTVV